MSRSWRVYLRWGSLAILATLASPAVADDDVASEFGLGAVPTFKNEAAAQAGCAGDGVVWADHRTGLYYPKYAPEYGVSPTGAFTCFKQAKKADCWSLGGTAASMDSSRGRVFPIYPEPDCIWVVDKQGKGHCGAAGM